MERIAGRLAQVANGSSARQGKGALSATILVASSIALLLANRALKRGSTWLLRATLLLAVAGPGAACSLEILAHWQVGLRPADSSYAALVYAFITVQSQLVIAVILMGLYAIARSVAGKVSAVRRVTFDNTRILGHYAVAQGLLGLFIVHVAPRLAL